MKKIFIFLSIFWLTGYFFVSAIPAKAVSDYDYKYIDQSPNPILKPGESIILWIKLKNIGNKIWDSNIVHLGTSNQKDRNSVFMPSANNAPELINTRTNWVSNNRIQMEKKSVEINETVAFGFYMKIPLGQSVGVYREYFQPVADGINWMKDIGIYWDITVIKPDIEKIGQPDSSQDLPVYPKEEPKSVIITKPSPTTPEPVTPINSNVYNVLLDVPQFYQLPLSCEATSLDMVLALRGASPGLQTLVNQVGFDNSPIQKTGNDVISWGDPYSAFVGNIYGVQYVTGYGVYWDRVARVGSLYAPSVAFTGWTISQILGEVRKGNPVIIWGSLTGGVDSWITPGGKEIYAVHGEHTRVVRGFDGTLDNPSMIYVNDPYYGPLAVSASAFSSFTSWFNNSGVVVY